MGFIGFLAGFFATIMIVGLVWYILSVIAYWKIFTKAGEAGWKSLIPFYNEYIQFKITWDTKFFWVLLALAIASGIVSSAFGSEGFGGILVGIIGIAALVISVISSFKLSVSFGHGIGFALGLVFLSPIFMLILGLGSSQYVGPNGIAGTSWE
ncbi:MAG: hypothetical protein IJT32_05110 [Lachnospiraceae bacterium]|nr:hypothetical protein [Lachnospiraceae bacterium]